MDPAETRGRFTFALRDLLALMVVVAVLLSVVVVALARMREAARKTQCSNQLKNVVLAMHNFDASFLRLPGKNAATLARISMITDILPYLETNSFSGSISLDETGIGPSILGVPEDQGGGTATEPGGALAWRLNPAVPQCAPGGSRASAVIRNYLPFNCPSDLGRRPGGLSYVPVVSPSRPEWLDRGARTSERALSAIWPASSEGTTGVILQPTLPPPYASRMNPPTLEDIPDGASNVIALAERVKGSVSGGVSRAENTAWYGAAGSGFVVGPDGKIADGQDNSARVDRCRQNAGVAAERVPRPNNNDLSGAQWFQYTCVWMGCANTMGPPNSVVCSAGDADAIAESGIAPPSSYHGPGANCGFADGTVRFISNDIDLRVFHALGTIDGDDELHAIAWGLP